MKMEILNVKMELSAWEVWDLLKNGSSNQRSFANALTFEEFNEFLREYQRFFEEYDIRDLLNGGCLAVEETSEDVEDMEYVIYENGRIAITLY